jgi:hypothetical protein
MKTRNIVRVPVHMDLFQDFITQSNDLRITYCSKGLPEDAVWVGTTWDIERMTIFMFFAHETFAPVDEGAIPPDLTPMLGHIYPTYEELDILNSYRLE